MKRDFLQAVGAPTLLASAIVISVCIAVAASMRFALFGLALGCMLLLASGAELRRIPGRLLPVNLFIVFIWLVVPFSHPGDPVWPWGWLSVSRQGLALCLLVTLKANAIFFVFYALVGNMPPDRLGSAMAGLGIPEKLIHLFLFAFRFWHVLADEWKRLQTAARIRAFNPSSSRHSYYTVASMLALLLVRANWRARRVYEAMLLRGFSGHFHYCGSARAGRADLAFALAMLAALSLLAALA